MRSEGYSSWFACLSVCMSTLILALQATRASKLKWRFSCCILERYAVKTSEKANCIIALDLLLPDPLTLCTLGAQEFTTKGVYQLPHAIYMCS